MKDIAKELGLVTEPIQARKQEAVGTYKGYKPATYTKRNGTPGVMWVLHFLTADGEIKTINMLESSEREELVVDREYSARWVNGDFECVPGANGFENVTSGSII